MASGSIFVCCCTCLQLDVGISEKKYLSPGASFWFCSPQESWTPPAGRRTSSPSSPLSSSPENTTTEALKPSSRLLQFDLDLRLRSVWASTSRDRPRRSSRPARHRAGRTGAGAGHGATHGGAPVAPDLRVSRGERRRQVEFRVPIDVGAGRPWLGGLRRWLPGFVAVGLPAARHPPPGPGFSPIE